MFRLDKFAVSLFSVLFTSLRFFFYAFFPSESKKKWRKERERNPRDLLIYIERKCLGLTNLLYLCLVSLLF